MKITLNSIQQLHREAQPRQVQTDIETRYRQMPKRCIFHCILMYKKAGEKGMPQVVL